MATLNYLRLVLRWFGYDPKPKREIENLLEFLAKAKRPAIMVHPETIDKLPKGIKTEMPMYGVQVLTDSFMPKGDITGVDLAYLPKPTWSSIAPEIDFGLLPNHE